WIGFELLSTLPVRAVSVVQTSSTSRIRTTVFIYAQPSAADFNGESLFLRAYDGMSCAIGSRYRGCFVSVSTLTHVIRSLRRSPGFSTVAVLTIALGIGANTTLFSAYDRLILNPVTLPHPSSLVAIWMSNPALNFNAPAMSWPRYEEIR